MDGAKAYDLDLTDWKKVTRCIFLNRVGGREGCVENFQEVILIGTTFSADLGGSSSYSNENFED